MISEINENENESEICARSPPFTCSSGDVDKGKKCQDAPASAGEGLQREAGPGDVSEDLEENRPNKLRGEKKIGE